MKALKIIGIIVGIVVALGIIISIADPKKDGAGKLAVFRQNMKRDIERQVEIKKFPEIEELTVQDIPGGARIDGTVETETGALLPFSYTFIDSAGVYQMRGGVTP